MDLRKKVIMMLLSFGLVLFVGGGLLLYKGNDAVVLGMEKKGGILTAEQLKLSFDTVGGRIIREAVKEGQEVKKDDIVMELDSTDVDLSIEKVKTQIAQLDAQIQGKGTSIGLGTDQQKAALSAVNASYENKVLEYNRKLKLAQVGAISQSEMDLVKSNMDIAEANVLQQQKALEYTNQYFDIDSLKQQREGLMVQLKELMVKKQRLVLRAPEDGKVLNVVAKRGEIVAANTTVVLLESKRKYYDIYLNEQQVTVLHEGDSIIGYGIANDSRITGKIRLIAAAPGFADLKMSREKGQADLSSFQIRIFIDDGQLEARTGMTIEVKTDELAKR